MDFSGAPPILLPKSLLTQWQGLFLLHQSCKSPDLEIGAEKYVICDDFDFDNPRTDYDRACATEHSHFLLDVARGQGLVFSTEYDQMAWWPEERMLVNGSSLPELKNSDVNWEYPMEWQATESEFVLMNACNHGGDPDMDPNSFVCLDLTPGKYVVERANFTDDYVHILFRLRAV
ncbi:MAG: Imm21 family immunity protein [Spirochaetota bacterium]